MHPLAAIAATNAPPARDWSDDEREMMTFLLLDASPSGVDEHNATTTSSPKSSQSSQSTPTSSSSSPVTPSTKGTKGAPPLKGGKAKLSALERRAKHREVVRRSYHRNKAVLTDLKDTVKQLEAQMTALEMARSEEQPQPPLAATPPLELQRHVDVLAAQSAQLESEATQLQETLMTHQHFVAIVYSASTASEPSSDDDDDMEADDVHIVEQPWRSQTDDDVVSPDHHHHTRSKFYHSPHARGVNDATRQHESVAAASWPALGFQPLSLDQARVFVGETYHGILRFALSGRAVSSGARVMGWEDRRLVDGDTTVKFSLRKQFVGESADALMAETWQCFSDPECADKKFRGLMTLQILQHVNDDTIVALRDSLSPDGTTVFRCVYLLFRVRTRSGFIICSRSIDRLCVSESARTAAVPGGRAVQWVELFGWFVFDQLGYADPSAAELFHETGAQVEYGGSVDFGDASVLEAVVMDTLATVTRWESFMVTPSFRLPASAAA